MLLLVLAPGARGLALNALNTVIFAHAGALALARARREHDAQWGWRGIAAGLFAQTLNQAWATFSILRYGTAPPFPSWGDLLSILTLILIAISLLAWPLASASGSERWRKGLDGLGAGMAHDLNNALATIRACAELAMARPTFRSPDPAPRSNRSS